MQKFGQSQLQIKFSGSLPNATNSPAPSSEFSDHWKKTREKFKNRISGFYDSVVDAELNQIEATEKLAKSLLAQKKYTHALFIGIGGSSLGPMALIDALHPKTKDKIEFRFLENPDPIDWNRKIQDLEPAKTLVIVVTKSGGTYETMALWLKALEWLGKPLWQSNVVALTDPKSGELRRIVDAEKLMNLSIDSSIGGRFSVFTPVGTFALALAGLNAREFLNGAKLIRDYCDSVAPEENLFGSWIQFLDLHAVQQNIHVMMPYSTVAKTLGNWWVQLWAESLGKNRKGFTAIAAQGATDQHSIQQLLRDGPNDKVIWFVEIDTSAKPVLVPKMNFSSIDTPTCSEIGGIDLESLLKIELRATEKVFQNQKRPSLTLKLDSLSESAIGSFFFGQCVLTALMAEVLGVNAYDQPGVEEGKIYIKEQLLQKP